MAAIEDMHRDMMLYLDLTPDPNSSATERDFAHNILKNELTPGVQNKGGSARSNNLRSLPGSIPQGHAICLSISHSTAPSRLVNGVRLGFRFFRQ